MAQILGIGNINQVVVFIITLMALVLVPLVGTMLYRFLKVKVGSEKADYIVKMATLFVRALEQELPSRDLPGSEKKQIALLWLADFCEENGFLITDLELSNAIEAAVHVMNTMNVPDIEFMPPYIDGDQGA